ncbi:hypothetical protein F66182_4057 [Fusarium sp. NRRL 66182]|nr:hypothetical protein F66182_4057 [Fusarium sp. NRRL 66182]
MPLARLPIPLRVLLLAALCASTTSALPASHVFSRADTCKSDQTSCNSDLASFCCPEGNSCRLLAGQTTAVCCPEGETCNTIQPITCDIRGQDQKRFPNAPVKTIVFNVELQKCGGRCCPFGYSCEGEQCVLDKDQSEPPEGAELPNETSTAVPSAITTATGAIETISISAAPTSSSEPTEAAGAGSESSTDSESSAEEDSNSTDESGPATTSIIGGVVGGCIILLIIGIVVFLYVRRQKKHEKTAGLEKGSHIYGYGRRSNSDASFGNIISEPISQPNSYRADFILKTPSTQRSSIMPERQLSNASNRLQPPPPRIRISIPNPFDSPNPSPNAAQPGPGDDDESIRRGNVRLPPIRTMKASSYYSRRPATPELQREPSSENINIFADPSTVKPRPLTRATTFTDLMDEADLGAVRRGKPYVPGTTPRI